jgi:hypothetical protein
MYFSKMVGLHLMFFIKMMEQVGLALQMFRWEEKQRHLSHPSMEKHVHVIGDDEHIIQIGHWTQQLFQQFYFWILH